MTVREQLQYMVSVNKTVAGRLLDDMTDEESVVMIDKIPNHIRWQTGHMVYSNGFALTQLGSEDMEWRKYDKLFGGGSKIAGDPSVYPSIAELRETLNSFYDRELELLENISDEDLERDVGEEGKPMPAWKRFSFMCMHDFYHAGQIVQIRRALGRERPFD
jgi:uncharacterized damage-inducible protein DinB